MLTRGEQARLLLLARRSLEARVRRHAAPPVPPGGALDLPHGVFVTLHCGGELRGCLGRVEADTPLGIAVSDLAGAVSDSDPRFPPVRVAELRSLAIEISVLTAMREAAPDRIEVGRHGVMVASGSRRGLLLPRVASEQGWDGPTLLEHACVKAGLRRDAWRTGARVLVFEAVVFGERLRTE